MAGSSLDTRVAALLDEGKEDEAKELLLERGYFRDSDAEARATYERLFPRPAEPEKGLDEALSDLGAASVEARRKAARKLSRLTHRSTSLLLRPWLRDPRVVAAMLAALDDDDDKVVIDALRAVGELSRRYAYPDPRIHDRVLALAPGRNGKIKIAIALSIAHFGTPAVWSLLAQALDWKPAKAAQHALGMMVGRYGQKADADQQRILAERLLTALGPQRDPEVVTMLVAGLRNIGGADAVAALTEAKARTTSRSLLETIDEAIAACRAR